MCCSLRDLLSLSPCQWHEVELELQSPGQAASLARWLEPRRHLLSSAAFRQDWFRALTDVAPPIDAAPLLRALSGARALRELTVSLPEGTCLAVPSLELPALRTLSLSASCVSLGAEFSQLTALEAARIFGFSLGGSFDLPAVADAAFPPSLRSLTFCGDYNRHDLPPAIMAAGGWLEELRWLSTCSNDEGLGTLGTLRTLCIDGAEFGLPRRVTALTRLERLCITTNDI